MSNSESPKFEFTELNAPQHGADIEAASLRYNIPVSDWLDLSAAINPHTYPLASLSAQQLRQLPYSLNTAREAAKNYCAAPVSPVFAAGSQVLIQWLPLVHRALCEGRRVAVPKIGYAEHAFRWQWAGYEIVYYDPREPASIDQLLQRETIDVLVIISPHNPLAHAIAPKQLLTWHAALQRHRGWLIVDEAFVDAAPHLSLASMTDMPGLIVLRSLGKFFGLAGVRCGYAFCHRSIAQPLEVAIGPWPLSAVALSAAAQALRDTAWQTAMRKQLEQWSERNRQLLLSTPLANAQKNYRHVLFNSIELKASEAVAIENYFAKCAIRVRRIELDADTALLRFGLVDPDDKHNWSRLNAAIDGAISEKN